MSPKAFAHNFKEPAVHQLTCALVPLWPDAPDDLMAMIAVGDGEILMRHQVVSPDLDPFALPDEQPRLERLVLRHEGGAALEEGGARRAPNSKHFAQHCPQGRGRRESSDVLTFWLHLQTESKSKVK